MNHYVIGAEGCDDSTYALVELTEEQAAGVRICLEAINARADYSCKPELYFHEGATADSYKLERAVEEVGA